MQWKKSEKEESYAENAVQFSFIFKEWGFENFLYLSSYISE